MAFAVPAIATSLGASAATAATLGTVASYASFGLKALGAIKGFQGQKYEAKANANAAKYNAAIASNNAIIARQNSELEARKGNAEVEAKQMETRARIGAIKASQGASGVDVNYGSAVDVRSSAAMSGQLSAINIRANAARRAYGYEAEADQYDAQSTLYKAQAVNEKNAGNIKANSTLLGGLAETGMAFDEYLDSKSALT